MSKSTKNNIKMNILLFFMSTLIYLILMIDSTNADGWKCAACITANIPPCVAKCYAESGGVPQLVLACTLECEVEAADGVCRGVC